MEGIGWYISDTHARRAIGYLTSSVPELGRSNVPKLAEAWADALEKTMDVNEPSPIGPEVSRPPSASVESPPNESLLRRAYDLIQLAGMTRPSPFTRGEMLRLHQWCEDYAKRDPVAPSAPDAAYRDLWGLVDALWPSLTDFQRERLRPTMAKGLKHFNLPDVIIERRGQEAYDADEHAAQGGTE